MPYYHVILKRFTEPFDAATQREIDTLYARVRKEVPGCLAMHSGPNVSPFAKDYTDLHISVWETREAHDAYQQHPLHARLVEIQVPRMVAAVGDLDATGGPDTMPEMPRES